MSELSLFAKTANFAARKHRDQRRKDKEASPYINHPIGVAYLAMSLGGITDLVVLQAALLHDTVEDTNTTYEELVSEFGKEVADVVMEVTDDKSLPKAERKRAQVEHVPLISKRAKLVKLCDKLYNLSDLISNPPPGYSLERIQGYCLWARLVLDGARGINAALENALDDEIFNGSFVFEGLTYKCCPKDLDEKYIFPTS
jgi:guanosine-3',5'-bis(diphosphate) 3'-pyrophosphohydrolase